MSLMKDDTCDKKTDTIGGTTSFFSHGLLRYILKKVLLKYGVYTFAGIEHVLFVFKWYNVYHITQYKDVITFIPIVKI